MILVQERSWLLAFLRDHDCSENPSLVSDNGQGRGHLLRDEVSKKPEGKPKLQRGKPNWASRRTAEVALPLGLDWSSWSVIAIGEWYDLVRYIAVYYLFFQLRFSGCCVRDDWFDNR